MTFKIRKTEFESLIIHIIPHMSLFVERNHLNFGPKLVTVKKCTNSVFLAKKFHFVPYMPPKWLF